MPYGLLAGTLVGPDDARLDAFYQTLYLAEFAAQREPIEAWRRALRGDAPYELAIRIVGDAGGDAGAAGIAAGIAYELYPASRCGLVTYMAVAPAHRRAGLGKRLQRAAIRELVARGARIVFGEVDDPAARSGDDAELAWRRLERNQRWGARVVDTRYVQPALGPGLARDRGLVLIALAGDDALPDALPGATVDAFVRELYRATEGGEPDAEIAIAERVRLVERRRA